MIKLTFHILYGCHKPSARVLECPENILLYPHKGHAVYRDAVGLRSGVLLFSFTSNF